MHKNYKKIIAELMAAVMIAPTAVSISEPPKAYAYELLGETSFSHKMIPWHTVENSPAKQDFELSDGNVHIKILIPEGADKERWDLQFRHMSLDFKKGHEYKVSFKSKAKRDGMELYSFIGNLSDSEEYFVLDGSTNDMHMGPDMGGQWPSSSVRLTTEWQTYEGIFKPANDIEAAQWAFQYARGTKYSGNAKSGDELWFDDMSIEDLTDDITSPPVYNYGYTARGFSGLENNFISVNQLGYYQNLEKTATLGNNKGDFTYGAKYFKLDKVYDYEIVRVSDDEVVYTGKTGTPKKDADSGDTVSIIDFSEFNELGEYYIRIKGEDWRSFPFKIGNDIYSDSEHNMLTNALNYFYQNRSGADIESEYITSGEKNKLAHAGVHKTETGYVQNKWKNEYLADDEATHYYASSKLDASGGWYKADDHSKNMTEGGISLWTLQNMYERATCLQDGIKKFADGSGTVVIPESGNKYPDILDECRYELDFMSRMKVQPDEKTWGKYSGMYYHCINDHIWRSLTNRLDYIGYEDIRIIKPPTFAATLNYAACAAQGARLWAQYDAEYADKLLESAKEAYQAYKVNWYEAKADEYSNEVSFYAPQNLWKGTNESPETEVSADAYWAACELFAATGDEVYGNDLRAYKDAFKVEPTLYTVIDDPYNTISSSYGAGFYAFDMRNRGALGSLSLLLNKDKLGDGLKADELKKLSSSVTEAADKYVEMENKQGYGIPYTSYDDYSYSSYATDPYISGYEEGSDARVVNNAVIMAYAYDLTKDTGYLNGAAGAMDYLLGRNPLAFSFITGYGSYGVKNPYHSYWANSKDPEFPKAPHGVLVGGPNAYLTDNTVRGLGFVPGRSSNASQRCYVDNIESWSTNATAVEWNSPLAWVVSFLQDEGTGGVYVPEKPEATTQPVTTQPVTTDPTDIQDKGYLIGDADLDGTVGLSDITMLAKHLLSSALVPEKTAGSELFLRNSDTNLDGAVDTLDLSLLIEYNLGTAQFPDIRSLIN